MVCPAGSGRNGKDNKKIRKLQERILKIEDKA
jgi:hypothetical protein